MRRDEAAVQERLAARIKAVAWRDVERSSGSGTGLRAGSAADAGAGAGAGGPAGQQQPVARLEGGGGSVTRPGLVQQLRRRIGGGSSSDDGVRGSSGSGAVVIVPAIRGGGTPPRSRVGTPRRANLSAHFTAADEAAILIAARSGSAGDI